VEKCGEFSVSFAFKKTGVFEVLPAMKLEALINRQRGLCARAVWVCVYLMFDN